MNFKIWLEENGHKFPLSTEWFIHFTLKENIPNILQTGQLSTSNTEPGYVVFGISLSYGIWFPGVQYTHIKGGEIAAIKFQTDKLPKYGYPEEVVWESPVKLKNASVISTVEAINLLKNTPYTIGEDDEVHYY